MGWLPAVVLSNATDVKPSDGVGVKGCNIREKVFQWTKPRVKGVWGEATGGGVATPSVSRSCQPLEAVTRSKQLRQGQPLLDIRYRTQRQPLNALDGFDDALWASLMPVPTSLGGWSSGPAVETCLA